MFNGGYLLLYKLFGKVLGQNEIRCIKEILISHGGGDLEFGYIFNFVE